VGGDQSAGLYFQTYAPTGRRGSVRWRLLSGNNRDMGRGALDYPDLESCVLGLKEIVHRIDALEKKIMPAGDNRWQWQMLLDDEVVAVSGHAFDRRVRCEMSSTRFMQLAPLADFRGGPTLRYPRTRGRYDVRCEEMG
jgi:hypothetical protein